MDKIGVSDPNTLPTSEGELSFVPPLLNMDSSDENSQELQVNQHGLGPTSPTLTLAGAGFISWPNYVACSSNGKIWTCRVLSPRPPPVIHDGSVILALPARKNDLLKSERVRSSEAPRTFKINSLEIGSWKVKANDSVSLSANIHFGWQNLLWQIEERGQKTRRIQFKWGNISAMKVSGEGERPGSVAIKLKEAPKFLCENGINPVTRRVAWTETEDFTQGEAQSQWHVVKCAPASVKYDVQKILDLDSRLLELCKEKPTGPESNLVENQYGPSGEHPEAQVAINHGSEASPSVDPTTYVQPPVQDPVAANIVPGEIRPIDIPVPELDPKDFQDLEDLDPTLFDNLSGDNRPNHIPLEMDPEFFEGLEDLIPSGF